jgi:hypothetical protein
MSVAEGFSESCSTQAVDGEHPTFLTNTLEGYRYTNKARRAQAKKEFQPALVWLRLCSPRLAACGYLKNWDAPL